MIFSILTLVSSVMYVVPLFKVLCPKRLEGMPKKPNTVIIYNRVVHIKAVSIVFGFIFTFLQFMIFRLIPTQNVQLGSVLRFIADISIVESGVIALELIALNGLVKTLSCQRCRQRTFRPHDNNVEMSPKKVCESESVKGLE